MSNYYKYTSGNAFELNSSDYSGYFTISDGVAYTGRRVSQLSSILTPKQNFITEVYINELEFDDPVSLEYNYSNLFDIINKNELDKLFTSLNLNNILLYKNLISYNPYVVNYNNNFHFYGLSSTERDIRTNDVPSGKTVYTHIDPFSYSSEYYFLDFVEKSDFSVDSSENFTYWCVVSGDLYTVTGSFSSTAPIEYEKTTLTGVTDVYIDENTKDLYITTNDEIQIYEYLTYDDCGVLNLKDRIDKSDPTSQVKIGYEQTIEVVNNVITIKSKTNGSVVDILDFTNTDGIISFDLRDVDDLLMVLYKTNGEYYIVFNDETLGDPILLENVSDTTEVKFTSFDSGVFFTYNENAAELRTIKNPTYPTSVLTGEGMLYLDDYFWNTTYEKFGKIQIKWNSNSMKSNSFNPLHINLKSYNDKIYSILHCVGRIYVAFHDIEEFYSKNISKSLAKTFMGVKCSESSFGIHFNNICFEILTDTYNILLKANKLISKENGGVAYQLIQDTITEIKDMKIHSNETINTISLQRILDNIFEIQKNLLI